MRNVFPKYLALFRKVFLSCDRCDRCETETKTLSLPELRLLLRRIANGMQEKVYQLLDIQ